VKKKEEGVGTWNASPSFASGVALRTAFGAAVAAAATAAAAASAFF